MDAPHAIPDRSSHAGLSMANACISLLALLVLALGCGGGQIQDDQASDAPNESILVKNARRMARQCNSSVSDLYDTRNGLLAFRSKRARRAVEAVEECITQAEWRQNYPTPSADRPMDDTPTGRICIGGRACGNTCIPSSYECPSSGKWLRSSGPVCKKGCHK